MNCPKCGTAELKAITIDGVEVDQCATCSGLWFDRRELGDLLNRNTQRVGEILGGEDEQGKDYYRGKCPRDGQDMLRVRSSRNRDVTLDACHVCQGIWLDGGEFERIKKVRPKISLGDLV